MLYRNDWLCEGLTAHYVIVAAMRARTPSRSFTVNIKDTISLYMWKTTVTWHLANQSLLIGPYLIIHILSLYLVPCVMIFTVESDLNGESHVYHLSYREHCVKHAIYAYPHHTVAV